MHRPAFVETAHLSAAFIQIFSLRVGHVVKPVVLDVDAAHFSVLDTAQVVYLEERDGRRADAGCAGQCATPKSTGFQVSELGDGGYRLEFYSRADTPGYGKLYVQEIDQFGNIVREFKQTLGPNGPLETKWVHGSPQ